MKPFLVSENFSSAQATSFEGLGRISLEMIALKGASILATFMLFITVIKGGI